MMEKPRSLVAKDSDKKYYSEIEKGLQDPTLMSGRFRKEYDFLLTKEIPKTKAEEGMVIFANSSLEEKAKKYIDTTFPVTENNVHKVPHALLEKFMGSSEIAAIYVPVFHEIFSSDRLSDMSFLHVITHEMSHSKGYNMFHITEGENKGHLDSLISGVSFNSKDAKYMYLESLNEAITESIAKETTEGYYKSKGFDKKLDEITSTYNMFNSSFSESLLDRTEILTFQKGDELGSLAPQTFPYPRSRDFLGMLIDDTFIKHKDIFQSRDEVKEIFFKAYFTGDRGKIVELVDSTYGAGAFENFLKIDKRKIVAVGNDVEKKAQNLSAYILELKERKK